MGNFVERLRGLIAKATPGPWVEDDGFLHSVPLGKLVDEWIATRLRQEEPDFERPETVVATFDQELPNFQNDADFVVFICNHAEALAEVVEEVKADHWGQHGKCSVCAALRKLEESND